MPYLHVCRRESRRHNRRQGAAEHLSHHGLGHAKEPEAAATDEEVCEPERMELRRPDGHIRGNVVLQTGVAQGKGTRELNEFKRQTKARKVSATNQARRGREVSEVKSSAFQFRPRVRPTAVHGIRGVRTCCPVVRAPLGSAAWGRSTKKDRGVRPREVNPRHARLCINVRM